MIQLWSMSKIKVGLSLMIFLIFLPLLLVLGQNYRFWNLSKLIKLVSVNINESALFLLFYPIFIFFMPIGFIIGKFEEVLKYQYPLITFIFTVITTLLYCYLLSSIILFMFSKGKLLLKGDSLPKNKSK